MSLELRPVDVVNTTDSAVRITHIPTGISVSSRTKNLDINKSKGMKILRTRLYELSDLELTKKDLKVQNKDW